MALTKTQVSELYVAIFNRAAEGEGSQFWQDSNLSAAEAATAMLATDAAADYFGTSLDTDQAFVEHIYLNTLNKTPADDAAGIQFWVDALASGTSRGDMVVGLISAAQDPANAGAAQDQFLNRIAVSNYATDNIETVDVNDLDPLTFSKGLIVTSNSSTVATANAAIDELDEAGGSTGGSGETGETVVLTDGRDNVEGTADNDTFYADAGQNQNGAIANAFSTGDVIDGGAGRDKIVASIMEDQEVASGTDSFINARTMNVEEAYFEAMSINTFDDTITVDAGRMDSVDQFWSNDSSANLVIDDVRLGSKLSVTKDITFGLRDVDVDAGLSAWFDTNSLTNEGSSQVNSALVIRAADVSTETNATPLSNVELEIGFTVGTETVSIVVQSTDGTYAGLRNAIETALADAGQSDLNVSLGNQYNEVVFAGNTTTLPFTAQEILITDPNGNEFTNVDFQTSNINPVPGGFLLAGNAAPQDPSITTTLIESNLILDNAGRGSTAGDVYIGGMSGSGKVVEKLNLTVDRSSKIDDLLTGYDRTGNTAFQQIVVDSGTAQGDLVIGNIGNAESFDSTAFTGANLSVSGDAGIDSPAAAQDVDGNADDEIYVYNTSAANDTVNVSYALDKAAEFADYSLSINTGAGADAVTLTSVDTGTNNLPNQQDLNNVIINTGAGDDVVKTPGAGNVQIDTGAGNDTVYTDNTGDKAQWVFNAQNNNIDDLRGDALTSQLLYKSSITVTLSGAGIAALNDAAGGGVMAGIGGAVAGTDGIESTVKIELPSGQFYGNQADINDAIMKAINEDAVLSKLLVAVDGPDNTLVINSLIDGAFDATDLNVDFAAPTYGDFSSTEAAALLSAVQVANGDSTITTAGVWGAGAPAAGDVVQAPYAAVVDDAYYNGIGTEVLTTTGGGTASTSISDNEINLGSGDDVLVLGTTVGAGEVDSSNETIVFEGSNIGNNTVVNFADAGAGVDQLDFTSYLDTKVSASGSSSSAVLVGITGVDGVAANAATTLGVDNVTEVTGFNSNAVAGETWDALNAANFLAAIQDTNASTYGNLGDIDPQAALANLVGNSRSHIVAIENDANAGEYKFFDLTSSDDGTTVEFTSATMIGTVDFGANVDFATVDILVG